MNAFPFHIDELTAQERAGVTMSGAGIRPFMPDQHRLFFASLRYVFATAAGADGWPVATVLTGEPGFISSPDPQTLRIVLPSETGAGRLAMKELFAQGKQVGLLGLELANRRRNRANGRVTQMEEIAHEGAAVVTVVTIAVDQSFGNCPQYIQRREVRNAPEDGDAPGEIDMFTGLDASARIAIAGADTFFVASHARSGGASGGYDMSHRGGRPGFVHIEGEDLWIPDFRGNNFFNTLGNLTGEPRAALLFIDFERGDILHLRGEAEIHWRPEAMRHFDGAERFWRFRVIRGWRQAAALPLRWSFIDAAPTTLASGSWHIA